MMICSVCGKECLAETAPRITGAESDCIAVSNCCKAPVRTAFDLPKGGEKEVTPENRRKIEKAYFAIAASANHICNIIEQKQKNPAHITRTDSHFVLVFIDYEKEDWTDRTIEASDWTSVTWRSDLGLFVAVAIGGTYRAATSPDGITWTDKTIEAEELQTNEKK